MACCALRIFPLDTLGSFSNTAETTAKGARGDAEPIRVGALGREHLLMAPLAAAPAAAAEPSVPTPATESSAAAARPSSSSSAPSPAAVALDREVEMANLVPGRR